ncbi:hypothetical protein VOLCADRAFT_103957 [Volvox carteri f. nagariensis]|uniref:Mitochondrial ribosomal protein L27 n=1 Tax=Volvox carteri f. nagariensis TaxID=3068 RepID=D8TQA7_VOLCA|nr:uncharacterized protein VOLCADRAFT_103957 [Volvox carteri f. nagariensis]EFJ50502.1 hypothetical protein VOLCADRAFT_103957 [Volvox carteri f. nagariensis]|eukprot:XP_002948627.1 hypothetical protein VOLCADRAFT_103957 [Volvox carteri f. nagariensis]
MLPSFCSNQYGAIALLRGVVNTALQQGALPSASEGLGVFTQHRTATKKAGGTAKQSVGSHPKHLGMKMFDGELAFPGMILARQRGTKFHPGQNVGLGRDHTLFATNVGTVRVSTGTGPGGKERRYINVEPLPEVLMAAGANARAAAASSTGPTSQRAYQNLIVEDLVKRRAQIKRAMLRGSVPLEPALYFNLPTTPDGKLSWLERTRPHVDAARVAHAVERKSRQGRAPGSVR